MDTATSVAIASGMTTFGGIVTLIITQYFQARKAREDRATVQQKVAVVAETLQKESAHTSERLTEIHTLVDGNLSRLQKEFNAMSRAFADAQKTIAAMKTPIAQKKTAKSKTRAK